jgi:long-chain acyl-CoA synthetase
MNPYFVGFLVPAAVSLLLCKRRNVQKKRGVPVEAGGEPGYAIRNYRFEQPVETHWEGVTTLAELFERSCKEFVHMPLLGTRKLISRETEQGPGGRSFEKLHLGEYEWKCYAEVFKSVCNFSSGLVRLGHQKNQRVAIFAETRAEWQIALQVVFAFNP